MSVIILPVRQPAPKIDHRFEAVTKAGRRIAITYTTKANEDERAVLQDLRSSLHPEAGAIIAPASDMSPLAAAGTAAMAWFLLCALGFFVLVLSSFAFGFDDALLPGFRRNSGWLGVWLLRGALIGQVVVPILAWLVTRREDKRRLAS